MWGEGLENLLHIQVKIAFYLTSSSRNTTLLQHPTKTNTMANVAFRFISLQLIQSPVAVKPNLAVPILIWRRLGELIRFLFFSDSIWPGCSQSNHLSQQICVTRRQLTGTRKTVARDKILEKLNKTPPRFVRRGDDRQQSYGWYRGSRFFAHASDRREQVNDWYRPRNCEILP